MLEFLYLVQNLFSENKLSQREFAAVAKRRPEMKDRRQTTSNSEPQTQHRNIDFSGGQNWY